MKDLTRLKILLMVVSLLLLVSIAAPANALWWMGYHKPAFKGRVLDAETKEPIEGAVVVVSYTKETMAIPSHNTSIIEVKEALTDAKGNFEIPSYTTIVGPFSHETKADFIIYKPGYGKFPEGAVKPRLGYVYSKVPGGTETFGTTSTEMSSEDFFSDEVGKEREFWGYYYRYNPEKGREITKVSLPMGIVELPRLKTREERRFAHPAPVGDTSDWKKQKNLIRLIREEYKFLYNEYPDNLYKYE